MHKLEDWLKLINLDNGNELEIRARERRQSIYMVYTHTVCAHTQRIADPHTEKTIKSKILSHSLVATNCNHKFLSTLIII